MADVGRGKESENGEGRGVSQCWKVGENKRVLSCEGDANMERQLPRFTRVERQDGFSDDAFPTGCCFTAAALPYMNKPKLITTKTPVNALTRGPSVEEEWPDPRP